MRISGQPRMSSSLRRLKRLKRKRCSIEWSEIRRTKWWGQTHFPASFRARMSAISFRVETSLPSSLAFSLFLCHPISVALALSFSLSSSIFSFPRSAVDWGLTPTSLVILVRALAWPWTETLTESWLNSTCGCWGEERDKALVRRKKFENEYVVQTFL